MTILKTNHKHNKQYIIKGNFHLHTYYSDGIYSPKAVLKYAKKRGILAVSITDHNMIKGAQIAQKFAKKYGLIYFPGIECAFSVDGKYYEILAYFNNLDDLETFYEDFLSTDNFIPVYSTIKELTTIIENHNGVAIAPHPFGRKGVFRHKVKGKRVVFGGNGYEEINAFTGRIRNSRAKKFLNNDNCLAFGAADMHFFKAAMDVCYTELKSPKAISHEELWANFKRTKDSIRFKPKGKCFPPHMIWFQKAMCALRLDLFRHYIYFILRRLRHLKRVDTETHKTIN